MVQFRANTIKEIDANKIATKFAKWCNNKSDCLYKTKKRKFHGWLNLTNLSTKSKIAQCGWEDGNCNRSTQYGIGGYHNVCPIGGFNGDLPWPAKLQFLNFKFSSADKLNSVSKIKSITVHFEHRMVGVDTGTGKKYDNFGPTFHSKNENWVAKVYFTNGSKVVSEVKKHSSNPKLSKKEFNSVNYKFTGISISELLKSNFALNIEYNHNYNTNPGIIFLKNVYIDVEYTKGEINKIYIDGKSNASSLHTSNDSVCCTKAVHTIDAGYKSGGKVVSPSMAPKKLGSKIFCKKKPANVEVVQKSQNDYQKKFEIIDKSNTAGKKFITYSISGEPSQEVTLEYTAYIKQKPSYSILTEYKANEDFDPNKNYIIFKNGCSSNIKIYVDSINSEPITLNVSNQNSSINLLNSASIRTFHNAIKQLECGYHNLYIRRGAESIQDAQKNKVVIKINPMEFKFKIYTSENPQGELRFAQRKTSINGATSGIDSRYSKIKIERIDDEPIEVIPELKLIDETKPSTIELKTNVRKGDVLEHLIDKYYSGEYYISISDTNSCSSKPVNAKMIIDSNHKQNFDYLFTRGERGTAFDFDYLVAWEGDNIREPLSIDDISLQSSKNDIRICSDSVQTGLSQIGVVDLKIKNKTNKTIEGLEIELNTLVLNDKGEKEVTSSEWVDSDGIFNQFYTLFDEYNKKLNKNVEVLNLTPDNDFIDEENVYLFIKQIDPLDTITIHLPFRSVSEKTVYLQYLLFEDPLVINSIGNCDSLTSSEETDIQIGVYDSMLTKLDISGNTDLLVLDRAYDCPDECYTTKDTNELYQPISDVQSGGITYKITNIDTNDFESQRASTKIINSNELKPYGYILHGNYYALIDNNDNPISVQEEGALFGNQLNWIQQEGIINKPMSSQNIICNVHFPGSEELSYTVKTNKNGLANFFIPIPSFIDETYTINELLSEVLYFEFKEQREYNGAILTKNNSIPNAPIDVNKNNVIVDYGNDYKRYKPGEVVNIPIFVSANIKTHQNYFIFNAELNDIGGSDEVTILYKVCNIENNEGIFQTTFKTDDKQLIPNQISKNIYCGIVSEVKVDAKIEKKIVESSNLNILYVTVTNQKKENKDVEIQINLGKHPLEYLGNYDFIDINIDTGDYSIIEKNGNTYISWLIGKMEPFEKELSIIKIQAKDIGLSDIKIDSFDYLYNKNINSINVKQSKCSKCENNTEWKVTDSLWKEFNGVWYKLFPDGRYKRPTKSIIKDGKSTRIWVDKE